MVIKVKKLDENAVLPTRGSDQSAGWDLYALPQKDEFFNPVVITVNGAETKMIRTGLAIEIPEGYFGAIYARSGLAAKDGIRPANCVGIIDSDYRGEVLVAAHNDKSNVDCEHRQIEGTTYIPVVIESRHNSHEIHGGDRIAQLVIQKFEDIELQEVSQLSVTGRGDGGFGSTGE